MAAKPMRALALDAVSVLVFAGIGRASHDEGLSVAGFARTAWPFLTGLAIGWLLVRVAFGEWPARLLHCIPIWLSTVAAGMALRAVSGQGTAASFIVVATIVLGLFLFGWRAAALALGGRHR